MATKSRSKYSAQVRALAAHLKVKPSTISECRFGDNQYESTDEPGEYLVLTDSEADQVASEQLDSYIEECILDQLPENLRCYFDNDSFKRDALISDGRGHTISSYDGEENEEKIDGEYYFIYRVN
jgi:hypothetical protein